MALLDDFSVSSTENCNAVGSRDSFTIGNIASVVTTSRSRGVNSESAWVKRTYCMVNEADQTQPDVLSWSTDGQVFEIKDMDALKSDLFRKYHGDTKFESFTRRLRRYGFHRVRLEPLTKSSSRHGNAVLAFRHESFCRDRPDLLSNLAIVSQTNESSQKAPSEGEDHLAGAKSTIARIEKTQSELKNTIMEFKKLEQEQKRCIEHLRKESITKDQTIQSLEFRLELLENNLLMAGPAPLPQRQPTWALSKNTLSQQAPSRHPKLLTMSSSALSSMLSSQQQQAPQLATSFKPSQCQLPRERSIGLERETSAISLMPFLDDLVVAQQEQGGNISFDHHHHDEQPTIPRSKKMKLYHHGSCDRGLLGHIHHPPTSSIW